MLNFMTLKKEAWEHQISREIWVKLVCSKFIKGALPHISKGLWKWFKSLWIFGEIRQQVVIHFWMSDIKLGWPRSACRRNGLTLHTSPIIDGFFPPGSGRP